MITSNLMGGLGNQLFQIMAAYSLSREAQDDFYFDLDSCYTPAQGFVASKYRNSIFKNLKNYSNKNFNHKVYNEPCFSFREIPKEKNLRLNGYFQSEKYFEQYKNDINNLFNFDYEKMNQIRNTFLNLSNNQQLTAIHVRRGDYLSNPSFHPVQNKEYYETAMSLLPNSTYVFVSDDMNWCKQNFNGDNILFSEFTSELDDLYLIMMCDNKIISNSSFSWWGSYLSSFQNKTISPKTWFGPSGPQDTQDIFLKNWIKI